MDHLTSDKSPTMDAVSVAIPTRDPDPGFFTQALTSVLAQSRMVDRLIVVDNSIKDPAAVRQMCESFGPVVEYLAPIRDLTASENHQRALVECRTPFVCILQDDDLYSPAFIATALEAFADNPDASLFAVNYAVIDEAGNLVRARGWHNFPTGTLTPGRFISHAVEFMSPVHLSASMFRRDAAVSNAFYEVDGNCTDIGFFLRLACAGPVMLVDEPLTSVREHSRSLSFGQGFYGREGSIAVSVAPVEWQTKSRFMASKPASVALGAELGPLRKRARNRILRGYLNIITRRGYSLRDRASCVRSLGQLLLG